MAALKPVKIIKKIRQASGVWRFVSLPRIRERYVWDKRPGYFLEWWEGRKRRRGVGRRTPSKASEGRRDKGNQLVRELVVGRATITSPIMPPLSNGSGSASNRAADSEERL